ncbi:MAG: hypothetical protein H6760_00295 [Candidatus Nomurabacteria bacterium]|nr:MAG: hypothetical protein H6760_00295 [Candidatus Nomurabacteria bacterium]
MVESSNPKKGLLDRFLKGTPDEKATVLRSVGMGTGSGGATAKRDFNALLYRSSQITDQMREAYAEFRRGLSIEQLEAVRRIEATLNDVGSVRSWLELNDDQRIEVAENYSTTTVPQQEVADAVRGAAGALQRGTASMAGFRERHRAGLEEKKQKWQEEDEARARRREAVRGWLRNPFRR